MFDALYAAAVNPGHSWSQMECSTALCIDTTNNRVGVGTMTPQTTFDVNGAVKLGNFTTCNANTEGTIRYQGGAVSFCYNSTWNNIRNLNWQCGDDFTDTRNGRIYRTIQLGPYCWMKDNLTYVVPGSEGYTFPCSAGVDCGGMYRGQEYVSCPPGWHLSTLAEWNYLIQHYSPATSNFLFRPEGFHMSLNGSYQTQTKTCINPGYTATYLARDGGLNYVCGYAKGATTINCVYSSVVHGAARCVKG